MSVQGSTFTQRISNVAKRLDGDASEVWEVHDKACAMADNGEDVLLLSVGDPDLDTHPDTINHVIDRLREGRTHYSPSSGEDSLRRIIADVEDRSARRPCSVDEVLIFPGATNAIYAVMRTLLNEGDEVILAEPMYIGYHGIFDSIGAKQVRIPLNAADNFSLDMEKLKASVTEKTKVIFINTPGNPAGNMLSEAELRELADFSYRNNIWLVSDEVYSMITFKERHTSLRKAAEHLDNIIVIDGLSKSHAMTGWRMGWTVAPESISKHLLNFSASTVFGCCQFVQDAAAYALQNDSAYMEEIRGEYQSRRDYVCQRVAAIPKLSCPTPDAGMFVMVDISQVAEDGQDFAHRLLDAQGVSVLPGIGFGEVTRNFVRISLAQPVEILEPAFDRIEGFINSLL
ncbi:pyridoxal phosphate-dependent aminotransferase [Porticoccus sp. W117]|uniref:pyridoxal phosphate-dependent aminotransferase n=1 Tax=Porticoccus sp. W117 TaxID=3054777 RepID=UPI002599AF50|nr:pyridoxal phosphate-dependent aminotransferase [Porticoccus sp. W117]MDM3869797.1 pyridoxal phosphate-dependent aminotransferase [Porticoccus sp. W117]